MITTISTLFYRRLNIYELNVILPLKQLIYVSLNAAQTSTTVNLEFCSTNNDSETHFS